MATPGMCKALMFLALIILGLLTIAVAVPTMIAASIGGPVAGLVVGIVAAWLYVRKSTEAGSKRVICTSGGVAGLCGGLLAKQLGGALGIAGGAFATLGVFLVMFFVMSKIVWK